MIKSKEIADPDSCLNRAASDEMVFVLLGRDPAAADAIRYWANRRVAIGKNDPDDPQIVEALLCASRMRGSSAESESLFIESRSWGSPEYHRVRAALIVVMTKLLADSDGKLRAAPETHLKIAERISNRLRAPATVEGFTEGGRSTIVARALGVEVVW